MRPLIWFPRTCRAVVAVSCGIEDAGAEKFEAGAAIHGQFDSLDAIDLPFDGACGPGQVEGGLNGWEVPSYAVRNPVHGDQSFRAHPLFWCSWMEHGAAMGHIGRVSEEV